MDKNEANILENIKDINLINSDLKTAKDDIQELRTKLALLGGGGVRNDKGEQNGYSINEIADNLSQELKKN